MLTGQRFSKGLTAILLALGLMGWVGTQTVFAEDVTRVHFEFRWNNPTDWSWNQVKNTKSGYALKSNTVTVPWYSANAWGHSYLAGGTGNTDVSDGHTYQVHANTTYNMYNMLVEWYGTGNNAFIHAWSYSNGAGWGYWHADH